MPALKSLFEGFDKIDKISKIIIKAGCLVSLAFLLGGMLYYWNLTLTNNTYYTDFLLATQVVKTSVMTFTEALMGAILFDYISSHRQ